MYKIIGNLLGRLSLNELDTQIALQCAPVLCQIKISNLLIIENPKNKEIQYLFQNSIFHPRMIFSADKKSYYFLYIKEWWEAYLHATVVQEGLKRFGYGTMEVEQMIQSIAIRYRAYIEQQEPFPHEIGIFLGYPLEDVFQFAQNGGKNYQYLGYWKGYSDLEYCKEETIRYQKAKEILLRYLVRGGNLWQLVHS